ncbi:MAG: hypothetical protein LBT40_02070 [Deltaproteobacteria bacterium]|nr:hypothetical protein [Deltaproteobacteria bacterium]
MCVLARIRSIAACRRSWAGFSVKSGAGGSSVKSGAGWSSVKSGAGWSSVKSGAAKKPRASETAWKA